ncbi:pectinesterase-like isoform X5 [Diospyros lotus]|uniref:pectinesterase-like isoform X5 n=1 Tax=Diospyros lotus TaxID=55363 RepID=UPI002258E0FB|nr:pectinesterase-like isoform X5 [Diospyros lotus]
MDTLVSTIFLAFLGIHVLILPFDGVHCATKSSICNQTPYPEVCNSFLDAHTLGTVDETPFRVRESALGATLNQAQLAHSLVKEMDLSSFDQRAKSAWADCLELYEDMISLMDQSIGSTDPASSQTWLSAAITNHQTCQNGFNDFNLSSLLQSFPTMSGDFSKLLSNSLAINKVVAASSTAQVSDKQIRGRRLLGDGFPAWVSAGDRNLLQSTGSAVKADLVVAKDGSGNYRTITEAVAAAAKRSGSSRFVIHVKAGVYSENVEIKKSMKNLMFIGDGIDATVVTGNRNVQDGSTTFQSATFAVSGDGFIARDMTFQNTAGPQKHQAVALRSGSDLSVFYSCSFKGYQDTLYVYSQRQFYRNCDVYGTVDFIFGNAATVFQNCNIYVRKPMSNQKNTVTAQSRTDPNQNTGIIVHNSIVTPASDLTPVVASFQSYLGRPWQQYSRTVFMKCSLGSLIDPAGWLPWSGNFALSTLYYGEYMNTGAGASTSGRVRWAGYHVITSAAEASKFTVGNFLAGNSWIPATGVPFTAGL